MNEHQTISYVEFAAVDLEATKTFFTRVFGWSFTDYGPDYCDSPDGGIMTGFFRAPLQSRQETGGALITFYSSNLNAIQTEIESVGGTITKPIFTFPGGCRFHFTEPSGNEFAVWSDRDVLS